MEFYGHQKQKIYNIKVTKAYGEYRMLTAIDFSEYKRNQKYYGGSERKEGITIDGEDYMIKYQKQTAFGKRNNHISEFIGSHIFELCGIQAHKTYLGYRNGEQVVACKDFNATDKQFVPFNDVGESTLDQDKENYQYDYEDITVKISDAVFHALTDRKGCIILQNCYNAINCRRRRKWQAV